MTDSSPARSAAELQAEIEASRASLVETIAELKAQTTPEALARRGLAAVRGVFTDEYGGIRPERVAVAAAAVVGVVVLRRWRRSRRCTCR